MTGPTPTVVDDLWRLGADPTAIAAAAQGWRALATGCAETRDGGDEAGRPLRDGGWAGDAAAAYAEHRRRVGADLEAAAAAASEIAAALDAAAHALATAQGLLSDAFARVATRVATAAGAGRVTFAPRTAEEAAAVRAATAEAGQLRAELDADLLAAAARIERARPPVASVAAAWEAPPEAAGVAWLDDGRSVVLHTGPGDDTVAVDADPRTGAHTVTVNGEVVALPAGRRLTIRAGGGHDTVTVAAGVRVGLTLLGGDGDDVLRGGAGDDRVAGLAGRDDIEGGAGDDRLTAGAARQRGPDELPVVEWVDGGAGQDAVHGGPGRAVLLGGDGDDRVFGGSDDDTVDGGAGDDLLGGGAGIDNVHGRDGADVAAGGDGRDYVDGGAGADALSGGPGRDTVQGLSGDDTVDGGAEQDQVDGGQGADRVDGGTGDDVVAGGRGDDTVRAGDGDDRLYAGFGDDTADAGDAGAGRDVAYGPAGGVPRGTEHPVTVDITEVGSYIKIEGSPEFVERVAADLDLLRASPTGQQLLGNLERAHEASRHPLYEGDGLTIRETPDDNGRAEPNPTGLLGHQHPSIEYNPSFDTLYDGPPVVILYHELGHVFDYVNGTLREGTYTGPGNEDVPVRERVATGLPIDHDGDPTTPERIAPEHPLQFTENGLRAELGAPHRPRY